MVIEVVKVWLDDTRIYVKTRDGRIGSDLIANFRLLNNATPEQRANFEVDKFGIHWPDIDEDLCFDGFNYSKPEYQVQEFAK